MHYNCPYCNAPLELADLRPVYFTAPCCNKLVICIDDTEPRYALRVARKADLNLHKIEGDITPHVSDDDIPMPERVPRWAYVYMDGYFWYVRIIPPCDLREHGRGHGVALSNRYTTKEEAERFADSMESYFGTAEKLLSGVKCLTCGDNGHVGRLLPDGYDSEPCPDCNKQGE